MRTPLDFTRKELILELNLGMVFKGSKILSFGDEAILEARKKLIDNFTIVVKFEGSTSIGIKMRTEQAEEMIVPFFTIAFLVEKDGEMRSHSDAAAVSEDVLVAYANIRNRLLDFTKHDVSFSTCLAGYNYEVYNG